MKLISLSMTNFRRFRKAEMVFPDGMIGIIGDNGTGKSTVVEAIAFALYGSIALRDRGGKDMVRHVHAPAGEPCSVVLDFEFSGHRYSIERVYSGSAMTQNARLIVDGMPTANGAKQVTAKIEEDLNMRFDPFSISVYARQKELDRLLDSRLANRKELIIRLMGLEAIDKAVGIVKDRIKERRMGIGVMEEDTARLPSIKEEIADCQKELNAERKELKAIEKDLKAFESRIQASEKELEAIREAERSASTIRERISNAVGMMDGFSGSLNRIASEIEKGRKLAEKVPEMEEKVSSLASLEEDLKQMEKAVDASRRRERLTRSIGEKRVQLETVEKELSKKNDVEFELGPAEIEERLKELDEEIVRNSKTGKEATTGLGRKKAELKAVEERLKGCGSRLKDLEAQGPESVCPECERPLADHFKTLISKYGKEKSDIEESRKSIALEIDELMADNKRIELEAETARQEVSRLGKMKLELESIGKDIKHLEERRVSLMKDIASNEKDLEEIGGQEMDPVKMDKVRVQVASLRKERDRLIGARETISRLGELETEKDELEKKVRSAEREKASLELKLKDLGFDKAVLMKAKTGYDSLRGELKDQEMKRQSAGESVARLESSMEGLQTVANDLEERVKSVTEKRRDLNLHENLQKLFKDFRTHMIGKVRTELTLFASDWVSRFTDNRYDTIEIDEDYNVFVREGAEIYQANRYSGGEVDVISLALRMAISEILTRRSGAPINMMALDEVFGSQDESRRRNILTALSRMSSDFDQIILITHIGEVRDHLEHVFIVDAHEDGSSTITEA